MQTFRRFDLVGESLSREMRFLGGSMGRITNRWFKPWKGGEVLEYRIESLNIACSRCPISQMENFGTVCRLFPVHQDREKLIEKIMKRQWGMTNEKQL